MEDCYERIAGCFHLLSYSDRISHCKSPGDPYEQDVPLLCRSSPIGDRFLPVVWPSCRCDVDLVLKEGEDATIGWDIYVLNT